MVILYLFIILPTLSSLSLIKYTFDDYVDDFPRLSLSNRKNDKIFQILEKYWDNYKLRHSHKLRSVEIKEVRKMLNCKDRFFLFKCFACDTLRAIQSSCNSRVCTSCGKKHTDKWSKRLVKTLYKKPHRHVVLTIPDKLWPYIKENQDILKLFMDCSRETFSYVLKETKHTEITPAYVSVLHTFGKDMKYNPHCHLIFAAGGFTKDKKWIDINYIDYKLLRTSWQKSVLGMLKRKLTPFYPEMPALVDSLYKKYPSGFYVRAKDTIKARDITIKYIGRYIRHPAIASSRIISYDEKNVKFFYIDSDTKEKIYRTMTTDEFITALIGHIPNIQFKVIRYYGAYSRASSKIYRKIMGIESIVQSTLAKFDFSVKRYAPKCDECGCSMSFVWYSGKGPPEKEVYGEKLGHWIEAFPTL
jgi:hypothetical protein